MGGRKGSVVVGRDPITRRSDRLAWCGWKGVCDEGRCPSRPRRSVQQNGWKGRECEGSCKSEDPGEMSSLKEKSPRKNKKRQNFVSETAHGPRQHVHSRLSRTAAAVEFMGRVFIYYLLDHVEVSQSLRAQTRHQSTAGRIIQRAQRAFDYYIRRLPSHLVLWVVSPCKKGPKSPSSSHISNVAFTLSIR